MSGLRVLLVYNPRAGGGLDVDRIITAAQEAGHAVEARSVKDEDWVRTVVDDWDLVATAGGDGTVRKVFKALAGTGRAATVLPVGTANNIARSLGLAEEEPARLIEGWRTGRLARFDLGRVSWGSGCEETFVESAGGGVFAAQLDRAEDLERKGEDKIEFGLRNLARVARTAVPEEWRVVADGRDRSGRFLGVEMMNVRETGPNIPVSPAAAIDDGALEVAFVGEEHRSSLVAYVDSRLASAPVEPPTFEVVRAGRLELQPPTDAPFHIDDELASHVAGETVTAEVGAEVRVLLPASVG